MSVYLISGSGTGVGKTVVTTALARGAHPTPIVALKPIETGVTDRPTDAVALAEACGRPGLADAPGFVRMRAPLAPYAATLGGEPAVQLGSLIEAIRAQVLADGITLVEGAGGLLVPIDATHTFADVARELDAKILLVVPDGLGAISHALTAYECAWTRGLDVAGILLSQHKKTHPARRTNARVIGDYVDCPVLKMPRVRDDAAITAAGIALWKQLTRGPADSAPALEAD
ncbi:MAG: dethiobiotin synthase [Sandaracinaceae bacterium]